MQARTLFCVISILMIVTGWTGSVQLTLAWIFVALRAAHTLIYMGFNHLSERFALRSFAILEVWARYALHAL